MRINAMILVLAGALFAAPSASAYERPSGTFCDTNNQSLCFTTQSGDSYKQIVGQKINSVGVFNTGENRYSYHPEGCWYLYSSIEVWRLYGSPHGSRICVRTGVISVGHVFNQYLFPDIPEEDKELLPILYRVTIRDLITNNNLIDRTININNRLGATLYDYCWFYSVDAGDGLKNQNVALDRTPPSIMQACGFKIKKSDYVPPQPSSPEPPQDTSDDVTIPDRAKPCGKVNNGNESVAVRSEAPSCAMAKRVIKSYSRTLRSPRGWSCSASMNDSRLKAQCSKKLVGRARAKRKQAVYGVWTRR